MIKAITPGGVDEYIAKCPKNVQDTIRKIRQAIRQVAPDSIETVSYFQMPGFSYGGNYYYNGMFAWISYKKPFIRLHVIPPVIQDHKKEFTGISTTKTVVNFPEDTDIPIALVKKLVKASITVMKSMN